MKAYLSIAELALWIALIAGQVFLCLCILKRRFFERLPWFSTYAFASAIENLLLIAIAFWGSYRLYYRAFYVSNYLESILVFLALIECGRQVLPGVGVPAREKAFAWFVASIATIGLMVSVGRLGGVQNRIEVGGYLTIGVAFIFIATYARYLGLYWSRLIAGIAFVLGTLHLVGAATRAITSAYPTLHKSVGIGSQAANILAVIAWTIVILMPWGEYDPTDDELAQARQMVDDIESNLRHVAAGGGK